MDRVISGGSHGRPRKRARSKAAVTRYWQIWGGLPCEWGLLVGVRCPGQELNHILHGQSKEDAAWNMVILCRKHHQDPVHGFHGVNGQEMLEKLVQMKLDQGFVLPREPYRYLPCGVDGAPNVEVDDELNFAVLQGLADHQERISMGRLG